MTPDVIRRQYLEAMGITAWASRYQLPNARPTEACEWEDAPAVTPPRERLHALLDDAPAPRSRHQSAEGDSTPAATGSALSPSSAPAAVRALLGQPPAPDNKPADAPVAAAQESSTQEKSPVSKVEPLTFSLSCICVGGRWLSLHEGEITPIEQQLLANMLRAAGVLNGEMPAVTYFKWPPMANTFTPQEPLEEAQDGVAAFIAGAAGRQGWQLERLLWWGADELADDSPLARVMAVSQQQSKTLSLPVWQGPALRTLAEHASAKRKLWPALVSLGQQWRAEVVTQ
ncbi:MAG: hypothetical protein GYB28_08700 [Gammaproteobacteria bacterium]|uniref:Uncharacterized protein n=1 Tax=Vreelandella venusta TaxID=44935 RepID=A0ABX2B895_9GAMM|nr:hypothetical protein [Halomonas venusta]AZM94597.1 hypothetical protein EI420_02385 [Halomonas venusta]MBR9925056.1 hypothetical protein [Gammaproteobacteria bacterium]NPT29081.1 hypothetical protein [Halomonas venusta]